MLEAARASATVAAEIGTSTGKAARMSSSSGTASPRRGSKLMGLWSGARPPSPGDWCNTAVAPCCTESGAVRSEGVQHRAQELGGLDGLDGHGTLVGQELIAGLGTVLLPT